ncbi:MAG: hypothetical protein HY240_04755 [Actinobacteria bacterium]|nr:hypothetical protein [Actinomycetota bacterium]
MADTREARDGRDGVPGAGREGRARSRRSGRVLAGLDFALGIAGIVLILAVVPRFYLSIYPRHSFAVPIGSDTPTYVWRSNVVIAGGLNALPGSSPFRTEANTSNADRPGYPVLAAITQAATGVDPWRLAFVVPAVGATTIALAAGAAGVGGSGEPRWSFAIYGLALGLAAPVVLSANGHLDNTLVDGTLVAAAAATLAAADGRPALGGAVVLLAASFLIHWMFAGLFTAILLGFALLLVPASVRARRRGTALLRTPAARVGAVVLLGGGLGLGGMWLTPGLQTFATRDRAGFRVKLDRWLPYLRLTRTVPAAGVGGLGLGVSRDGRRLRALGLWVAWLLPGVAAIVAFDRGLTIPAHRLGGFALGLWFLAAAAGAWLVRAAWRGPGRISPWLGAVAVVPAAAVVAASLVYGYRVAGPAWDRARPYVDSASVASVRAAGPYLDSLPAGTPIVVPVETRALGQDFGLLPAFRRIRALVPADRAADVYVYLGDPANLLAGRPTLKPDVPEYDAVSTLYWEALAPILRAAPPVVLAVDGYTPGAAQLALDRPQDVVAPGVVVLHGPAPVTVARLRVPAVPTLSALVADAARVLLLVGLVGLGWSVGLVRTELLSRLALAPAMGQAVLVVSGVLAGRAGVALHGPSAVRLAVGVGAAGWLWTLASIGARRAMSRRVPADS